MNILSMLARLESALGRDDLTKQMVLIPQERTLKAKASRDLNFVVGYNGSPRSQTALDLTLWIAYQTRLASHRQVTVQVVYVVDLEGECKQSQPRQISTIAAQNEIISSPWEVRGYRQTTNRHRSGGAIAELPNPNEVATNRQSCQFDQFEQADRILWQARHLAEEWRGSLETHLRFGQVAKELRNVVEAESAALLLLGCESVENDVVQQLGPAFPCPVLGIPPAL